MDNKTLTLSAYQKQAATTAIYATEHAILYPALGLAGEAGEVSNKVKKILRDKAFDRDAIAAEVGDVLWYIAALCRDLGVDMGDLAQANLDKLADRQKRGTLQGNGDVR